MSKITETSKVKIHYVGKDNDGEVFDASKEIEGTPFKGTDPIEVELGTGTIIPGFETALVGLGEGESKEFTIEKKDAYGDYREELIMEVEKQYVPEDVTPNTMLTAQDPNGNPMVVTVLEVNDDTVKLDANHKLAGKDLTFNVEVVEVLS